MISFVKGGLQISGVPDHLRLRNAGAPMPAHVMYVWLDALINYITAVGFPDTHERAVHDLLGLPTCTWSRKNSPLPRRLLARVPDGR